MADNEKKSFIDPVRLGPKTHFRFKCHKDVSCFTRCCREINLILTPYDILLLKNRLGLSSTEFLAIYTDLHFWEKTDLPVVTLKMMDDAEKSCPFVREDGCLVYADRPTTCRYYPLGVATLSNKEEGAADNKDADDFFFSINEEHCKGFEEKTDWTVTEWRRDQGVDIHDEINEGWTELVVMKRSYPSNIKLTEKSKQMFFMACYDLDRFKRFIFDSEFLKVHEIDGETLEKIKADEIELLRFSFKWLKWVLFKKGDFKLNPEAQAQRQAEKDA